MTISLTEFLAQIGHAGQMASHTTAQALKKHIENLCEEDEDGTLNPKMMTVNVDGSEVKIPVLALMPLTHLNMDRLDVQFETDIRLNENKLPKNTQIPPSKLVIGLKNGLAEQDTHIAVTARFRMNEPTESIETLRDRLNDKLKEL